MILLDLDELLAGHLALAVHAHRVRLRADRFPCPPALEQLEVALLARSRRVTTGQDYAPFPLVHGPVQPLPMPMLLTITQAAREAAVSVSTVKREIAAGHLSVVRVGRSVRIHCDDLTAYLDNLRTRPMRATITHKGAQ